MINWLRDAYAMERGMETSLEKHSKNDDLSPEIRELAGMHLEETRRHAEEIKSALRSLDADTSALKTSLGVMAQAAKGMGTAFASDERVKDLLDAYSMEHFEIACYTALAAAAERADLLAIAEMCSNILSEEERMADSLRDVLPEEVVSFLFDRESTET